MDLNGDAIVVLREPREEGYGNIQTLGRGDALCPLAFPDLCFEVGSILGG